MIILSYYFTALKRKFNCANIWGAHWTRASAKLQPVSEYALPLDNDHGQTIEI
jgi:hypothetical protein